MLKNYQIYKFVFIFLFKFDNEGLFKKKFKFVRHIYFEHTQKFYFGLNVNYK